MSHLLHVSPWLALGLALLFALGPTAVRAQDGAASPAAQIQGVVTHSETGTPVPGVNVGLRGTPYGSVTGEEGRYVIPNVPAGAYTVVASYVGYATQERAVTVGPDETVTVDFRFNPESVELQEVEVVGRRATTYDAGYSFAATKVATALVDAPQSISVVTKEVIDDQQLYTLNEVTRNVSGVNTFSGYNDLTARGFRNQNTRLINGLKTEFGFWHAPILPHIERVEFIKGPASALFANANPGGTVNMVTKKPLAERRQALSISAGSFASYRSTADFTGPLTDDQSVLYRLNLGYENAETFRFLQGHESFLVAPSISFLPSRRTRVNADLVYSHRDGKLDRGQAIFFGNTDLTSTPIDFSLSQPSDYQTTADFYLTLSVRHAFSDWLTFNSSYLKYRYDEDLAEHRTSNVFLTDDPTVLQLAFIRRIQDRTVDNVTNYLVANVQTGPAEHRALAGFDYYRQDDNRSQWGARGDAHFLVPDGTGGVDSLAGGNVGNFDLDAPAYTLDRDPETYTANWFSVPRAQEPARAFTYGAYVQDQIDLGRLQVLLGLRHEWYNTRLPDPEATGDDSDAFENVAQTKLIPRVGVVYSLTDRVNVYTTFTQGFEPQDAALLQQPELYGGPFDPETSDLAEAGAKGTLFEGRLLATAAAYQITKRGVLVNANDPGNPDLLEQRGEVRSRGLEVDVVGSLTPNLRLTANYAFNEAVITASDVTEEVGRTNENAPRHQGGFWGKYVLQSGPLAGVGFGAGARFMTDRHTFEQSLQLPGFTVFDASVSYTIDRFRVTAYADNLTDEVYWTGGYNYGRIYPGAPRSFRIKVGYTFD